MIKDKQQSVPQIYTRCKKLFQLYDQFFELISINPAN